MEYLAPLLPARLLLLVACLTVGHKHVHACSTLSVGAQASEDGSVFASHSNDGEGDTDPRLVYIPAMDHLEGSMRPVFAAPESYPRYVGKLRGDIPAYEAKEGQKDFEPIGYIPQVNHTFAYFEETYGTINEYQVGISESTCSGIFGTSPAGAGGKALLSIDALSRIALERCTTAREAVQLMGHLAEEYGFYGPGSFEGTAESLHVIDPREAFVFHILPDDTGMSAVWVAQRVPDGEVAVVNNMFVVREVDLDDKHNFYGSANMHRIAMEHNLWDPSQGTLDFTKTFSDGEYAHKYYTGRRTWGMYHLLAPSRNFSAEYGDLKMDAPYPFSVKPDKKVSLADIMTIMRYMYQDTPYDMTQGLAAGAFGTPDRYSGGQGEQQVKGNWERSIGLFRTSDSYIVQARAWLPAEIGGVAWFGSHAAHGTCYIPFAIGMSDLPKSVQFGAQDELDKGSQFWASRYVLNIANLRYDYMSTDIAAAQDQWEREGQRVQAKVDAMVVQANMSQANATKIITDNYFAHAQKVLNAWWALVDQLMFKYADGWINEPVLGAAMGYPAWWLNDVGYADGPPPIPETSQDVIYV